MRSNLNEIPDLTRLLLDKGFVRLRIGFLELRKADPDLVSELLIYDPETAKRMATKVREIVKQSGKNTYLDLELFDEGQSQARLEQCTAYHDRIYVRHDGETFACYGKQRIGNIFDDGIEKCLASEAYENHCRTVTQKGNPVCSRCSFCRIMSLDNVNNHFGRRAIESYTHPVVEDSIQWVKKGQDVKEYWDRIYSVQVEI
jgi:sulfatase maturation enzyme AslB (radical SAM superfamily)